MKKILILSLFVTGPVIASQYAVQLEASKSPDLERYQSLSEYGTLYTIDGNNGYIRTRLGPYENKNAALDVLEQVHAAGFYDAYVAKKQTSGFTENTSLISSDVKKNQRSIENFDVKTLKEWKILTPEQQANVVYLDGVLHIKNGSQFTPLSEVISNK